MSPNDEGISLVNQEGDWKYKKINLMNVLRGFISQLKPGQDLTKISLPAELCYPYSLLEIIVFRELSVFQLLFSINQADTATERFFSVLKFIFCSIKSENLEKKPWNPILGETHVAYCNHPSQNIDARTFFVSEQTGHASPISTFYACNPIEQITLESNITFGVQFEGNYVSVVTSGPLWIKTDRFDEVYKLEKGFPDLVIRNVIWGKKYIMWQGDIVVECEKSGMRAYINFFEKNKKNFIKAYLISVNREEILFEFEGIAGGLITYGPSGSIEKKNFIDLDEVVIDEVHYLPYSKLKPHSSVLIWDKVNKAIVKNDIRLAGMEKNLLEQSQREIRQQLLNSGKEYEGEYFKLNPITNVWNYRGNFNINEVLEETSPLVEYDPNSVTSDDTESKVYEEVENINDSANNVQPSENNCNESYPYPNNKSPRLSNLDSKSSKIYDNELGESKDILSTSRQFISSSSPRDTKDVHDNQSSDIPSERKTKSRSKSSLNLVVRQELRAEKKKAREEQKQVMKTIKERKRQILTPLQNGEILSGWVKFRNSFKKWKERWFVLQHGRLIYFNRPEDVYKLACSGIILLNGCDIRFRPSKKNGSCFKIYSLNQYPIFSKTGLRGETLSRAFIPVCTEYAIMRVDKEKEAQKWVECIRKAIPDWKENKNLIKAGGLDLTFDSESESDIEESIVEGSNSSKSTENQDESGDEISRPSIQSEIFSNPNELMKRIYKLNLITISKQKKLNLIMNQKLIGIVEILRNIENHLPHGTSFKNPFDTKIKENQGKSSILFTRRFTILLLVFFFIIILYLNRLNNKLSRCE